MQCGFDDEQLPLNNYIDEADRKEDGEENIDENNKEEDYLHEGHKEEEHEEEEPYIFEDGDDDDDDDDEFFPWAPLGIRQQPSQRNNVLSANSQGDTLIATEAMEGMEKEKGGGRDDETSHCELLADAYWPLDIIEEASTNNTKTHMIVFSSKIHIVPFGAFEQDHVKSGSRTETTTETESYSQSSAERMAARPVPSPAPETQAAFSSPLYSPPVSDPVTKSITAAPCKILATSPPLPGEVVQNESSPSPPSLPPHPSPPPQLLPPVQEITQRVASDVSSLGFPEEYAESNQFSRKDLIQEGIVSKRCHVKSLHDSTVSSTDKDCHHKPTLVNNATTKPSLFPSDSTRKDSVSSLFRSIPAILEHLEYNLKEGVQGMSTAMKAASETLLGDLERVVQRDQSGYDKDNDSETEAETVDPHDTIHYASSPLKANTKRFSSRSSASRTETLDTHCRAMDKEKCLILLMEPKLKIFEIVQVLYQPELTTVGDILQQVRLDATDIRLAKQTYTGLTYQGIHITAPMVPIDMLLQAEVESKRFRKPILLAVPTLFSADQIEVLAPQLLTSPKVLHLLESHHPLLVTKDDYGSIKSPSKSSSQQHSHRRRHRHHHSCHQYHSTTPSLGQQVVSWVQMHYGDRI
jgi:hypothetical protein